MQNLRFFRMRFRPVYRESPIDDHASAVENYGNLKQLMDRGWLPSFAPLSHFRHSLTSCAD
jgi:hypothetical protein